MISKIIIAFLIAATIAVIWGSLYTLIHGKPRWLIAIVSTVCVAIFVSCILGSFSLTNSIIEYLARPKWAATTLIIWTFTVAIILDKEEEKHEEKQEAKEQKKA